MVVMLVMLVMLCSNVVVHLTKLWSLRWTTTIPARYDLETPLRLFKLMYAAPLKLLAAVYLLAVIVAGVGFRLDT